MNIDLGNIDGAKKAIQDLEYISREDANTYILKIKVLILEGSSSNVLDSVYQLQKCDNFKFQHLLSVIQDLVNLK